MTAMSDRPAWIPAPLTPETFLQMTEQAFVRGRFDAVLKQPKVRPFPEQPVYSRGWWNLWPRKPQEIGA